jgi:hypothetical protein
MYAANRASLTGRRSEIRIVFQGNLANRRLAAMIVFPSPEFLSKIHLTVLEIEGIVFNILLFCKFVLQEVRDLSRAIKRWAAKPSKTLKRAR